MRTIVTTQTLYDINELSEKSQQRALEAFQNVQLIDWENILGNYKQELFTFGIFDPTIYFTGFGSQGDGACFTGNFISKPSYPLNNLQSNEYTRIIEALLAYHKKHGEVSANIVHSGHYYHEYTMHIDSLEKTDPEKESDYLEESELLTILQDIAKWLYNRLSEEYDDRNSMIYFKTCCIINEWEFLNNGDIYGA